MLAERRWRLGLDHRAQQQHQIRRSGIAPIRLRLLEFENVFTQAIPSAKYHRQPRALRTLVIDPDVPTPQR